MFRSLARGAVVVAAALVGAAGLLVVSSRRFGRLVDADRRRLLDRPRPSHPPLVTEEMLAGLPEPARRYLRHAGVVGRPMVDTVRVRQACRMQPAPNGSRSRSPPSSGTGGASGVHLGRHRSRWPASRSSAAATATSRVDGPMTIKAGSLFPIVDAAGPEMDQASLLRYLSEMPWFPSSFLRDRVTWEAVDDSTSASRSATETAGRPAPWRSTPTVASSPSAPSATRGRRGLRAATVDGPDPRLRRVRGPAPPCPGGRSLDAARRHRARIHRGGAHRGGVRPATAGVR